MTVHPPAVRPSPTPACAHYRIARDGTLWVVLWRVGSDWVLVEGPSTRPKADEWISGMMNQMLGE